LEAPQPILKTLHSKFWSFLLRDTNIQTIFKICAAHIVMHPLALTIRFAVTFRYFSDYEEGARAEE
jgi:hypothetical protein